MSSTVTSWSPDTNTKASETTSTALNNATLSGPLTVTGATQLNSTLTVGVDATGYDVKFFGDTTSKYWLWDESADGVVLVGTSTQTGNSTITGNLTVSGTLTLGSGAELAEAELEMLDGITAGTAAASKALVLDSNKDIGTIRNLTIDGTFSDGNYTFDTSGNVTGLGNVTMTGDLTVSGGDITLGTTSIFSGGNTASLNNIDAIDATTEATIEAALDTLPNVSSIGGTAGSLTLSKEVSGSYVYMNILNSSSDDDSDAFYAATTFSNAGDPYIALVHSVEDDPDERWSLGVDGSTDIFKLSYRATNALLTPSTGSSYEMFTVSKTGNTTIAGSLTAKEQVNICSYMSADFNTTENFISLQGYSTVSTTPQLGHNYTFPCNGVLRYVYFIANDWNPNDSSNTQSWKCYRYRPDGSTNTGAFDTTGNWTALETISKNNASLQAEGRGIFVDFTDATCAFNKGDMMGISMTNSVDVTDGVLDQISIVVAIELDWNNPLTANI